MKMAEVAAPSQMRTAMPWRYGVLGTGGAGEWCPTNYGTYHTMIVMPNK